MECQEFNELLCDKEKNSAYENISWNYFELINFKKIIIIRKSHKGSSI